MKHKFQKPVHHYHSEIPVSKSEGNLEETLFATCLETAENKYTSEVYEIMNIEQSRTYVKQSQ